MIEINLLPEEMRQQEGTPWPRRLAIFAGAGVLTALAFLVAIQRFKSLPDARDERKALAAELDEANGRIQREVKPLQDALALLARRQEVVSKIQDGVVRWAPRLDGLQQVLTTALEGVWITAFSYEEVQAKAKAGARPSDQLERRLTITFAASDFSDGHDLFTMSNEEKMAEVTRSLMRHPAFRRDIIGIAFSSWSLTDDFLKPPWNVRAITFPVHFMLTPPPVPEAPKPAPAPAKKG